MNDILLELRDRYMLTEPEDGEVTTEDIAHGMGVSLDVARKWLKKEVQEGRLTQRWAKGPTGQKILAFRKPI